MIGLDASPSPGGDGEAMMCPGCQHPFDPVGRQRCCSEACRVAVYRRRREAVAAPVVAPRSTRRQPVAVYACDGCGARAVGERRCGGCQNAMRRVGLGGCCPCCEEPVAVDELLGQEVIV
ncbi:MAG: hypothetical protein LC808_31140 [Actinobacteria bacterium]|nr:hypothetical protein [Actinomycetota bacterium]